MLSLEKEQSYVDFVNYLKSINFDNLPSMAEFVRSYHEYWLNSVGEESEVFNFLRYTAVMAKFGPSFLTFYLLASQDA